MLEMGASGSVGALSDNLKALPGTGVFHLAASFKAERASEIERGSLEAWSVKAEAAWHLHRLTLGRKLRHFVLFSSVIGLHGNRNQAVYAAANAALAELARFRRGQGLPALAIALPIVVGAGRLGEPQHAHELLLNTGRGPGAISFIEVEQYLKKLLVSPEQIPPVVLLDAPSWRGYWEFFRQQRPVFAHLIPRDALTNERSMGEMKSPITIEKEVRTRVATLLGGKPEEINLDSRMSYLGLDSLAAVEFLTWTRETYGVEISMIKVLTEATVGSVVETIVSARCGCRHRNLTRQVSSELVEDFANLVDTEQKPASSPASDIKIKQVQSAAVTPQVMTPNGTNQTAGVASDNDPGFKQIALPQCESIKPGAWTIHIEEALTDESLRRLKKELLDHRQILVLRGTAGSEHFCLGMDLNQAKFGNAAMSEGLEHFAELAAILESAPMPVICVVEGNCRGGGMLFPSLATVVLATETASFGFPEIRQGGLPGFVSVAAQRRLRAVDCRRLMLSGDSFDAKTASQYGFVDFIGSKAAVEQELNRLLARFAVVELNLLNICQTNLPAASSELALVTMGALGRNGLNIEHRADSLVRLLHHPKEGIVLVELNDPVHNNAIDLPIAQDLCQAIQTVRALKDVRVAILQAAGDHFCVGANPYHLIQLMKDLPMLTAANVTNEIYNSFLSIRELGVPIICVVHGQVIGGGLAAMLTADYRICVADSTFNYGNLPRGVCPGFLLSENLERLVGHRWATELYLNDYTLSADEALAIGLVNEVCPNITQTKAVAWSMACRIGGYPTAGVRTTTALIRSVIDRSRLARESLGIARCNSRGGAFTGQWRGELRRAPAALLGRRVGISEASAQMAGGLPKASNVGIIALELYLPNHKVLQADLEHHYHCEGKFTVGLGQEALGFCGSDEDAVSMAMTAVYRLMTRHGIDWAQIGRLEVGTESQVDRSKSIKSYLMQLFEEHDCSNIEGADTYHACYGGTSALFNTIAWCQSDAWDGRYGMVVCVDIADQCEEYAFLGGAAAVAMLIGPDAALVMRAERASQMLHTWDFYKPMGWRDGFPLMPDGKRSIDVYMACLDGCQRALSKRLGSRGLLCQHDYFVFHCSSTYLVKRAFYQLVNNEAPEMSLEDKRLMFEKMVEPSTLLTRVIGSTYTASVYVNLYSLLLYHHEKTVGKRVGLYSYGSGASASFYGLEIVRLPLMDRGVDEYLSARCRYEPTSFLAITQEYSSCYGRFDFMPVDRGNDRIEGVFYLQKVDELGRRTYHQHTCVQRVHLEEVTPSLGEKSEVC
jgi:3-hydroxy-3-methylglutaryl CoA synthase/enoyl-CoA hydratase/carnithine racemase/acyl carrier protein